MVLRQEVFVVEQNCPYLDADNLDQHSWHLLGWKNTAADQDSPQLVACGRVVKKGLKFPEISIGRVATHCSVRGEGVGQQLMAELIRCIGSEAGEQPIRISAQHYLLKFYQSFDFKQVSEIYMEDDIPHIEMLRS